MKIVREYESAERFEKGIREEKDRGWNLDTWNVVAAANHIRGYTIIAVFVGRNG